MPPVVTLLWVGLVTVLWIGIVAGVWALVTAGSEYPPEVSRQSTDK